MAYDPTTDVDPGYDIEGHTADDDMGQQEQREQAAVSLRRVTPEVYSPTPAPKPTPQRQGITPYEPRSNRPPADGTFIVGDEEYGYKPDTSAPATGKVTYKDWGDQFVASALGSAGALASGVSWIAHQINSDPQYRSYADDVKDFAEKHAEATINGMSDKAKEVLRASLFGGSDRDAEGNAIPSASDVGWGSYLAMHAIGMVPDGLAMLLPGGILGRVAVKGLEMAGVAARAVKAGETVATLTKAGERAHAIGHAVGTGGYFSVENGGEMARTINNEIDKAPDLDLQSGSDVYKHLRDSGLGVDAAKAELKKQSTMMTVGAFAAGAVGGGGFGVLGKGVVRGAIAGAGAMGIQGGATQALQQGAEKAMGTRQDYDLGSIMSDTLTSGAGGLLLGGIGGRFAGRERAPKPGVDPDVGAALEPPPAATQGEFDLGGAPPGFPPGGASGAQGEMFRTAAEANAPPPAQGQGVPLTGAPAGPPAPGPVSSRAGGMPGAQQEALPINQTPPTIVPTTGQGEMFPSLPEANPPVQGARVPMTEQRGETPPTPAEIVRHPEALREFQDLQQRGFPTQEANYFRDRWGLTTDEFAAEQKKPPTTPPSGPTPPPTGPTGGAPTGKGALKKSLVDKLTGVDGAPTVQKLRRMKTGALKELDAQLSKASTPTQPDTTVVSGADRAPASETLARQGPSETAAPPVSGEALTPPVTPEGVRETKPATTTTPASTTGLTEGLSGAARAIGENLRNMLWGKHEAGDTTEGGKPSNILRASTYLKERGVITDRASFEKFLDDYGAAQKAGELKTKAGSDKFFEKQLTGQEPPTVRSEGGPSPDTMAKSGEGIASTPTPGTKASVPFMVTNAMKKQLADRGHSAEDIRNMTPQQAHDALAKPAEVPVERGKPPAAEAAVKVSKRKPAKKVLEIPRRTSEVYVEEPTKGTREELTEATPEVEQARADRAGDLAEAVRVVPAPKGSGMEAALRKAQRELGEAIGKTDGSKDAAAEAIDGWMGVQTTAPYPGTKVTPRMLGEHLMERVAGQRPTEREGARADIAETRREDAARRASEPKATAGDVENIAEARSEGAEGTSAITPEVKTSKRLDTTDQRRVVDNLIQRVLNHDMTPEEADREYGKPQEGPGAKRRWPRLADRLRDWIAHAEDPKVERDILEKLATTQNNDSLTPHEKSTQTKQLTRQLERTGPEFASELREHLRGMEDPVGQRADLEAKMAADKAARAAGKDEDELPVSTHAAQRDGISPQSSEYIKAARDEAFNQHLTDHIASSEARGEMATLHGLLDRIINHAATKGALRPMWELARKLKQLTNDMPVLSPSEVSDRGFLGRRQHAKFFDNPNTLTSGYHTVGTDHVPEHIALNPQATAPVETLLHEAVHAASSRLIDRLLEVDPNHRDLQVLRAIGRELLTQANNTLKDADYLRFHDDLHRFAQSALANPHEVHAWLMTNPVLQDFAARTAASPEFRKELTRLGYGPRPQGRSTWRYFTDWIRRTLGYGTSESGSETSFLDHVLRPLQDITEHGATYNARDALPADPVLRARAEPVFRTLSTSMGSRAREMINHVDPAGLGDRARRKILVATSNDAIHDWNKDILPSLTRWREANENISAASNEFAGKYGDRVQALNERINKADDKSNLSNLMVNVGVHGSHIGENLPADANVHLTTPEQLRGLHEDQAAYNALSAKDKATYNDTKKLYNEMYHDERKAQVESIINAFAPDLTQAQRDAFTTGVRSQRSLERFMADPDNSDIARAFGPDWGNKRSIVTNMAKLHNLGFVKGDYFPLRRFGNYVVSYGDRADLANYGVEMFDSYTKAQERRAELVRQGHTDVNQVAKKDDTHMGDIRARPAFADELASALRHSGFDQGHVEHVTDLMNDMLLRHATQSEAARARLRRRGVKGASTDATRVLSAEFLSKQARHGYLLHGLDRAQRLNDIHDEAKAHEGPSGTPGAAVRAMSVYQEIAKRMTKPEDHDNLVRKIASTANSVSFVQNLMSVSHMLTSTMETHGNSLALLGARHGYGATSLALIRAMKDASPAVSGGARNAIKALGNRLKTSDWNLVQAVTDEMASKRGVDGALMRMLGKEAVRTGIIDHTILQDIRQAMSPAGNIGTGAQKVWNMFYNSNAAMAHSVDVMNKLAVLKAAGELEMRKPGTTREQAVAHAIQMARRVMPNYTTANRSRLSSNPVMGTLLQFKRYGMHMYELMGNLARESVHGENKWEARKQLAGILATHSAMAGTLTLIADPLRYIGGAYDIMSGRATTSGFHDYQNDVRNWLSDTFGPEAGEIIARGAPHALGFDVHRRTGLANLLEVPEMTAFNKTGAAQVLLSLTTGAAGETLQSYIDGLRKFRNGDLGGAFKDFAPRPFRDAFKGADIAINGIRDTKGKVILPPEKIGISGGIIQALGFQPSSVSEFREGRAAVREAQMEQKGDRSQLTSRWLNADPADRPAVMSEIRQFNADPRNVGTRIQVSQLLQQLHQRQKDTHAPPGAFGLRMPKRGAEPLMHEGRFANG